MEKESTALHWLPLCRAAPAFNLIFIPCLPQLFSFKNRGLQEPPLHQQVARKTLHEFLMKCDMPDRPGLLEACYFEVFSSATLPFNKNCIFTHNYGIKSCALHLTCLEKSDSYILAQICDNQCLFCISQSCSSHLILCKKMFLFGLREAVYMHFKAMCVHVS